MSLIKPLPVVFDRFSVNNSELSPTVGTRKIHTISTTHLWGKNATEDQLTKMPNPHRVRAEARNARGMLTYLNIEHMDTANVWGSEADYISIPKIHAHHDILGQIVDLMHHEEPGLRLGFYKIPYIGPAKDPSYRKEQRKDAMREFKRQLLPNGEWGPEGLADKVDVIFPSLYIWYDYTIDEWTAFAWRSIAEARKFEKPVYVFISHRLMTEHARTHPNQSPDNPELWVSLDYWRGMWKALLEHDVLAPEGIVWWNYPGHQHPELKLYLEIMHEQLNLTWFRRTHGM